MQCVDAPCLKACPTESISRGEDGIVRINTDTCRGHGDCEDACPYGAIYVDPVRNVADKCNFCAHRLEAGMLPACVETCPTGARVFGDLDDPQSSINQAKATAKKVDVLKPQTGTRPKLFYLNSRFTNTALDQTPGNVVSEPDAD